MADKVISIDLSRCHHFCLTETRLDKQLAELGKQLRENGYWQAVAQARMLYEEWIRAEEMMRHLAYVESETEFELESEHDISSLFPDDFTTTASRPGVV